MSGGSRRAVWGWAAGVAVVLAAAGAVVLLGLPGGRESARDDAARAAAEKLAAAWQAGDLAGAPVADTGAAQATYQDVVAGLGGVTPETVEVTDVERDGEQATADLAVTWPFGQGWSYDTTVPLRGDLGGSEGGTWTAQLTPGVVHPDLEAGDRLRAERVPGARGEVLGRDGTPVVTSRPVVDVGVQPSRAEDLDALAADLADLVGVDGAALAERLAAADPEAFVPVITLRDQDAEPLRERLRALPGVLLRDSTLPLAPTREFARALLGSVGEATAEAVQESDGRLAAGDRAGLSGLQAQYDERLGGSAGVVVRRVPAAEGAEPVELFTAPATAGEDVATTLDVATQQAADAALAASQAGNGSRSLVAVSVSTGDVLAVANTPAAGSNRALTGQYPPGSTFKAVSTLALLEAGVDPAETVPCPATATVDGRSFGNAEDFELGAVPFRTDFARSCNTAFVALSSRLEPGDLTRAGASVGLGGDWGIGVPVFTGQVPQAESDVELASATIGQGRVLASPMAMAQVAATIAGGGWTAPQLVTTPAPEAADGEAPTPDADRLATVRRLMRLVATEGSASALGDVPGPPVHAKTGTAQYGTEDPPNTHAWTIGFSGDVAFAVVVEDAPSGAAAAVPVVEDFLRRLR